MIIRLLFAAAVVFAFSGRAVRLIPGYAAMPDEQKAQIDTKAFSRILGGFLVLLWLGFEAFPLIDRFGWIMWAFPVIVLIAAGVAVGRIIKKLR
jgi:hypothetical protein